MPGTGFGGMLANLFNPGLDQQVAASITPNANPLAQQDQSRVPPVPGAPSNPAPGQAPPQVTQPDPTLAQTNQLLMRAYQTQNAADSFNQGLQRMAAGYGTAQQQASKMAALGGQQGGGGQGYLDAIAKMQGIDAQQTAQTEHARAAANMSVLAKALNLPDTPDGIAQATEIWNSGMLPDFGRAAAQNTELSETTKNVNEAVKSWAAANPQASPQDIQNYRSGLFSQQISGLSGVGKELAEDRRNYMTAHPSATFAQMVSDKPELADETSYTAIKGEQAKTTAAAGEQRQNATETLPSIEPKYQDAVRITTWLQAHPEATARAVHWGSAAGGPVGQLAGAFGILDQDTKDARGYLDQLNDVNFAQGMQNTKNIRSVSEANKVGGSSANLDKRTNSDQQIASEIDRLANISRTGYANVLAAAGKQIPSKFTGLADPNYLTKGTPMYNGATEEKVSLQGMNKDEAEAAYEKMEPGTVFTSIDGSPKRKPWF